MKKLRNVESNELNFVSFFELKNFVFFEESFLER